MSAEECAGDDAQHHHRSSEGTHLDLWQAFAFIHRLVFSAAPSEEEWEDLTIAVIATDGWNC